MVKLKKTTTITKLHGLFYFDIFSSRGILFVSLKCSDKRGLKVLKCFHTKQLAKSYV